MMVTLREHFQQVKAQMEEEHASILNAIKKEIASYGDIQSVLQSFLDMIEAHIKHDAVNNDMAQEV